MKTLTVVVLATLLSAVAALAHEKHEHSAGPGLFGQPPEYVHVLLNPLPVYGLAIGIAALAIALLVRSKAAQAIALGIIVISSASDWAVTHYGENAYARIREQSDETGQKWLDEHMGRAHRLVYAFYATALLGITALVSLKRFPKAATPLTVVTLVFGVASLAAGGWISKAGGQIRHPEFRTGPPPSGKGHEHGAAPESSHDTMQHDKKQPPDTTGGHKHPGTGEQAQKTPLPDTLEGAWKAIHQHRGELQSAIKDKKFNDVQSHAERISALANRLVDLAHPDHKRVVENGVSKVSQALTELKASAETGSELVMKNNFQEFEKALTELEQQMKKQ